MQENNVSHLQNDSEYNIGAEEPRFVRIDLFIVLIRTEI